jgi:alkyldihydroxyacetonephosphate synthase
MKGSEGTFGILVGVTMKIFRYMPENRQRFSFMYPTWEAAVNASREIMQSEFGKPAIYRISDPEETDRGLQLYGMPGFVDKFLQKKGFLPMQRCLCLGNAEGDKDYTRLVKHKVMQIAREYGAIYLGGYAAKKWEKTRYTEPYMREDLGDYGILIDTLEAAVTWDNIHTLHQGARAYIKNRPHTMCMTHASHFYPQGTNLYFIFIAKMNDPDEYREFQKGIIDNIQRHGGSLSHHHGIGRMIAPWIETHLGREQMAVLKALKRHFDPNNIMNPGGQLGLDLDESQKREVQ